MKHTIVSKFIGILLAACALVSAAASAFGIFLMGNLNLYSASFEESKNLYRQERAELMARRLLERHTAMVLGGCEGDGLASAGRAFTDAELTEMMDLCPDSWAYHIADQDGITTERSENWLDGDYPYSYTTVLSVNYPVDIPGNLLEQYDVSASEYRDFYYVGQQIHYLYFFRAPEYTVTVNMASDALRDYNGISEHLLYQLFSLRYYAIAILAASLLVFAIAMVYLCCAAGKSAADDTPTPGGLNRVPLDVYLAVAGTSCLGLCWFAVFILREWFYSSTGNYNYGALALVIAVLLVAAIIGVAFLFAVAAQMKPKGLYWLKHSVIGFLCWQLGRGIRFCCRGIWRLTQMLPLIWRWILLGACMGFFPLLFFVLTYDGQEFFAILLILSLIVDMIIVCYGAYAYGTILSGAKRMAEGNLDSKIPTGFLIGSFCTCAKDLNALADVATIAARNQMKSERMKTELITNVSHDIKTPLTSIINYIDLLEKPHTPEQEQQYLEVLGRQSQRMKKLIEDLVEMSKATTGNMTVEITRLDAAETVNQALGEFADKLARARLTPVFRQPEEQVHMLADGRMTWRVLSNVLSNAVKYALPGTRLYVDLVKLDGKVLISLKNISREELNVSADELTERFVRGDASRNTEGSGLGLNIAKSLMELQKGQLRLLVDGDLFKVTLIFQTEETAGN